MAAMRASTLDIEDTLEDELARVFDEGENDEDMRHHGFPFEEVDASTAGNPPPMSYGPVAASGSGQASRAGPTTRRAMGATTFTRRFNTALSPTDPMDLDSD